METVWLSAGSALPRGTGRIVGADDVVERGFPAHRRVRAVAEAARDLNPDLGEIADLLLRKKRLKFVDEIAKEFQELVGGAYVRIGDRVHMIMDRYQNILQGQRTQLASRQLLPANADIVALELPGLKLTKNDQAWTVEPANDTLRAIRSAGNSRARISTSANRLPGQTRGP